MNEVHDDLQEGHAPGHLGDSTRRRIAIALRHPQAKATVFWHHDHGRSEVFGVADRNGRYVTGFVNESDAHALARQWAVEMGGSGAIKPDEIGLREDNVWDEGVWLPLGQRAAVRTPAEPPVGEDGQEEWAVGFLTPFGQTAEAQPTQQHEKEQ
jgi:hypothetical protein